ncbi:LacI family DNA-binding transcriptional regulator [Paenibacillus caui]|uniref:LacI family DNA-binding transcriptional regulator n=1 Tax=Paenibacillus caui TaxID=2873927 RepID=UPI001CA8D6A8|nr:LacI family DNA-binding transcriptional regulator [Paenibacillus caui]
MARKVSIQYLADQLGLSKYAVSRALSGKPGVSEATRARVVDLARTLGYRRQQTAVTGTREAKASPQFVLICMNQLNQLNASYWQRVLAGIIAGCSERGWHHIILSPGTRDSGKATTPEEAIAPHLDWRGCIGIIVIGSFSYPTLHTLADTGKPLVLVDHREPLLVCDKINHDNLEAGIAICRHMLAAKCRRIGFIGDEGRTPSFAERRIGVRIGVERFGTPDTRLLEWEVPYEEGGWTDALADRLLQIPEAERPEAWIGANDDIALQWMRKLQELGVDIPGQCRIGGIDNIYAAAQSTPLLTTVNLGKEELGERAVESLQRRIERPGSSTETVLLASTLIPRDSA